MTELKARVRWGLPQTRPSGVSYGYHYLSQHIGHAVIDDPNSRVALHCGPPESFTPVEGCVNVFFTMWESRDVPAPDIPRLRQADAIITPSRFCEDLYRRLCDCAVYYVPLGVDTDLFKYRPRSDPRKAVTGPRPFRWLACASPDPRKGWMMLAKAWEGGGYAKRDDCELYLKTSTQGEDRIKRVANVTWDCRKLSRPDLAALFDSADAFVYPSMAEGFGLTCAEAMSCGLPVLATAWSGHAEMVTDDTAWTIKHELHRMRVYSGTEKDSTHVDERCAARRAEQGLKGTGARENDIDSSEAAWHVEKCKCGHYEIGVPSVGSIIERMDRVMRLYEKRKRKAKRAARMIQERYTWDLFETNLTAALQDQGARLGRSSVVGTHTETLRQATARSS